MWYNLAKEMFKISKLYVPIVKVIFEKRNNTYNKSSAFLILTVKSAFHGRDSISYLSPKILGMIQVEMKILMTIRNFNSKPKVETSKLLMHMQAIYFIYGADFT